MATYKITAPDGNSYNITAPDNASQEDVLNYAKANYKSDSTKDVPTSMSQAFQKALETATPTPEIQQLFNASKPGRALEGAAQIGRFATKGLEQLGGLIGPNTATVAKKAGEFLLPQNKTEAALLPFSAEEKALSASKELAPVASKAIEKSGPLAKTIGAAISTTTGIPFRYASAVAKDPSILGDATKDISAMSKEYSKVFDRLGIQFNSDLVKKLTGKRYIPNDSEFSKLYNIMDSTLTKLEQGKKIDPGELFLARSAAAALKRNPTKYQGTAKSVINGGLEVLDRQLEDNGIPEIRQLSRDYFRAVAKEHFQPMFPQKKDLSPNAVRALIMLNQFAKAGQHLIGTEGEISPMKAAAEAVKGAAMSPLLIGQSLRGVDEASKILAKPQLRAAIPLSLKRFLSRRVNRMTGGPNADDSLGEP